MTAEALQIPSVFPGLQRLYHRLKAAVFETAVFFAAPGTSKAAAGDSRASAAANAMAERLLDTYGNAILRLAYSYVHNMSDAEEILQETMLRCLQTGPSFENKAHEKSWLFTVAANLSKNRIKYNSLRTTDELQDDLAVNEREDLSFVWEAVRSLPDHNREVIHLFYYEGLSTKEIAAIVKRKENTVRSDLARGRERLKRILKEAYDFEG